MKIRLNDILIIVFLALVSVIVKQVQFVPLIIAVLLIIFGGKIDNGIKNLVYISIATIPFLPFFIFFAFYLPFAIFGVIFENVTFIKRFVFGTCVALVLRLVTYYLSILGMPISEYLIITVTIVCLFISYGVYVRKKGLESLKKIFAVSNNDYKIMIVTLFFLFFVAGVIYNNDTLYSSNGTQIYGKQAFVIKSIEQFRFFPLYDPSTGMGEGLFLFDSPTHFMKDILIASTILLKHWYGEVLIYNAYSMFILWLTILGAALLVREIIGKEDNKLALYIIILGSLAIGLSIQFLRTLESFKAFSAHPINFLLLAIIISKPKKPVKFFAIAYLLLMSYLVHALQFIGVFILAIFLFIIIYLRDLESLKAALSYAKENILALVIVALIFLGIIVSPMSTSLMYSGYLPSHENKLFGDEPLKNFIDYIKLFFVDENTRPFSISYGSPQRLDQKQAGFFLTMFGSLSFIFVLINLRNKRLQKARYFNIAYLAHFLAYAAFINLFYIPNLELGYRSILPYSVVVLVISICAVFDSIEPKKLKIFLILIFFGFLLYGFYYGRTNLANIHNESIISNTTLKNEKDFVNSLPLDGRIITYGLFANAMDAGMATTTGHYFTRYQMNFLLDTNNIYEKVHSRNSLGDFPELAQIPGLELKNYLVMGGYKYMLLNVCHPIGQAVAEKVYPNYTSAMYQNQCFVFLQVNNATYADKVGVVKNVDENVYKNESGYKYISISRLPVHGFNADKILLNEKDNATDPIGLGFIRKNPNEVTILGNFMQGDWVVFKEEYFPRWSAYMNGKKIPVYATNHNLILMQTEKGTGIRLKYDLLPIEKIFAIISFVAVISCIIFFIIIIRNNPNSGSDFTA